MEVLISILAVAISVILIIDYIRKKRRNDMTRDMPGPRPLPIFGNALMYVGRSPADIMNFISQNKARYGRLYRVWIFNQLAVFSSYPQDIEIILSSPKHIKKNTLYDLLHSWLGTGLLLSTGQKWHQRRKIITPTFHFKILEQFVEIFDQQSFALVDKLNSLANGKEFDIHPYIALAALDIIAETAMGSKVHAQTDSECEYVRAVTEITNIMAYRFVNVWFRFDWFFSLFAPRMKYRESQAIKVLHSFTERIIEERRKALKNSLINKQEEADESEDIGSKKKMALLDVLLQSTVDGKPLTNKDIREEVDTFMFEGHDTTTSGMCFVLFCLSRHPKIQDKVFAEIREVIGDNKTKPITYRELQNLKYMECVIKEGLRLYPPVPIIGRMFTEDININGTILPAGTNYTVGIYVMLRDPEIFPEPDTFIPERHTIENTTEKSNPYAYIPFSAGPRNCIGQKFAMLEMKSTISKMLRHYEVLPAETDIQPTMNLVMRSYNGIHVSLKPRIYI